MGRDDILNMGWYFLKCMLSIMTIEFLNIISCSNFLLNFFAVDIAKCTWVSSKLCELIFYLLCVELFYLLSVDLSDHSALHPALHSHFANTCMLLLLLLLLHLKKVKEIEKTIQLQFEVKTNRKLCNYSLK